MSFFLTDKNLNRYNSVCSRLKWDFSLTCLWTQGPLLDLTLRRLLCGDGTWGMHNPTPVPDIQRPVKSTAVAKSVFDKSLPTALDMTEDDAAVAGNTIMADAGEDLTRSLETPLSSLASSSDDDKRSSILASISDYGKSSLGDDHVVQPAGTFTCSCTARLLDGPASVSTR